MRKCLWNDWHAEGEKKWNRWMEAGGKLPEEAVKCSQGIKRKARGALKKKHLLISTVFKRVWGSVIEWLSAADVFNTVAVITFTPGKNSYTVFHLTLVFPYGVTGRLCRPLRDAERFLVFVYRGEDVFFHRSEILDLNSVRTAFWDIIVHFLQMWRQLF